MSYHTEGELNSLAMQIADKIIQVDINERRALYTAVAMQLRLRTQNFQASLFEKIAQVA